MSGSSAEEPTLSLPPPNEVTFVAGCGFCIDRRRGEAIFSSSSSYARVEGHGAPARGQDWGEAGADFRYHAPQQSQEQRAQAFYAHFPALALPPAPPSPSLCQALGLPSPAAPLPWRFALLRHGPPPPFAAPPRGAAAPLFTSNGPVAWTLAHFLGEEEAEPSEAEVAPPQPPPPAAAPASAAATTLGPLEECIALPAPAQTPRQLSVYLTPP
jgi:hypothetical protein